MMDKMKTSWCAGLGEENARDVRKNFKESLVIRKRLRELLDKKIIENRNASLLKGAYDTPNWAYKQADSVGYERALNEIIKLIL